MANLPTENNNPGDLRYAGQLGASQGQGGFAGFPDAKTGYAALLNDLQTKINRNPNANLVDFSSEYAPSSDGNNVGQYAANLANKLGVRPDATLGSLQSRIGDLAQAVANNEGYDAGTTNNTNLPGVGALGGEIQAQNSEKFPQIPTPQPTPTIPTGSVGQSTGVPDPSKNPLSFASGLVNKIGLGDVADTFGSDIAAATNPDLHKQGLLPYPSYEQNAGALLKTAGTVGALAAAPESVLGAATVGGLAGATTQAGTALEKNAPASQVEQRAGIGGLLGGVTGGALAGIGKLLGSAGDKIMNAEIKPSKADIEDGFSIDNLKKYNLGGTLSQIQQKSQAALTDLYNQLSEKLASSGETLDLAPVYDKTVNDLKTGSNLMKGFGANTSMDGALKQLQNEILTVNPDGGISIPDAQLVKQGAGAMGAWSFGGTDPDATAREAVYNKFYTNLKEAIEQKSPQSVKLINRAMSEIIPIQNAVLRRIPIASRNNPLSLTDFIGLVASASHPAALGPTILNFLSKSGAVGNQLSKFAPKLGQATAPLVGLLASDFASPQTTTLSQTGAQ